MNVYKGTGMLLRNEKTLEEIVYDHAEVYKQLGFRSSLVDLAVRATLSALKIL
jgi:hypothetical protein